MGDPIMSKPQQLTWIAHLNHLLRSKRRLAQGYTVRALVEQDKVALAHVYFAAYPRQIVSDRAEAVKEMERTFLGEYGSLDPAASPIAFYGDAMVASVMTVVEAPWEDTPPGPFIIEVMVHPAHRKRGLAEYLVCHAARELIQRGMETVALRVMSDNTSALNLYRKLGFAAWNPDA
jgi:ribosomal protein S18 acetylase RimI-like enzyme